MLRSMFFVMFLALCLIGIPLAVHAQVENLVLNPSFEDENDIINDQWIENGWVTWGDADGLDSVVEFDEDEFIDGSVSARVEPTGTVNWHFMIIYYPVPLDVGELYTVSFWAKAEEERVITAQMKDVDNAGSFGATDFTITTDWNEYTFSAEAGWPSIKLEIFVSGSDIPLWFDFVNIYEGEYVEGIFPSERSIPGAVDPADKLPVRWSAIKAQ
jgi:hypothetical protein